MGDSDSGPRPLIRRADEIEYEAVSAAEGMHKGVLVGEDDGAPNLAIRRFVLDPGAEVPKHTNGVEHEQYVLEGEYVVGIGGGPSETAHEGGEAAGEEYTVSAGDSLFIPAGAVHWYRNEGDEAGAFICAVPTDDDSIDLVDR
jgi:quercetin dioxygenase-like cupin family protein